MSYIYDLADTWNDAATTFTSIKMNVTDTASNAASLLMDLQVGGSSKARVNKVGLFVSSDTGTNGFQAQYNTERNALLTWGGLHLYSAASVSFSSSGQHHDIGRDTYITRRGAANIRLGLGDTAAPVAQTLSVQSVVAGTTNTAGANLTITGSQGTGTGAGGSIIFQVAPAGSSGSAQNALADILTLQSANRAATFTGWISQTGTVVTLAANSFGSYNGAANLEVSQSIGLSAGPIVGNSPDVIMRRDAANTLALRNGANAQTFRVYNTYTSDTNYESGRLQWTGNEFRIGPETVGGTLRSMGLYVGNTRYQIIGSNFNQFDKSIYMNGANIATDTSTGFKIGTGATQKIGFWNATPIAQPTTAVAAATVAATGTGDVVAASTTFDGYTIPQIVTALRNAGLLA